VARRSSPAAGVAFRCGQHAGSGATVLEDDSDEHGWEKNYHGASDVPSAYVGVELHEFDESDHFELTRLTAIAFTPEQLVEAATKYEKIPMAVRAILPPFSIYVLWSTS